MPRPESEHPEIFDLNSTELAETNIPEHLEEVVRNFDHGYIKNEFQDIFTKSGITKDVEYQNQIRTDTNMIPMGSYRVTNGTWEIMLNPNTIKSYAIENGISPKLTTLHTFIHEQNHYVSDIPPNLINISDYHHRIGYARTIFGKDVKGGDTVVEAFTFFNEGVTERLSRQLTIKYLNDHPNFEIQREVDKFKERYNTPYPSNSYEVNVMFVDVLIDRISQDSGVSRETVWGSIIRGQFEDDVYNSAELHALFNEQIDTGFLTALANIDTEDNEKNAEAVYALFNKFIEKGISPDVKNRLKFLVDKMNEI